MDRRDKKLLVPTVSSDNSQKKPHYIAYTDWGDVSNTRVVICVHGLTRNCRDFDNLASSLSSHYRVICPDVVGRGQSDWLEDEKDYDYYPVYLSDAAMLIKHIRSQYGLPITVDWVGISMGGLIGMMTALNCEIEIRRLVMSDIGPLIPMTALRRMSEYVGKPVCFSDLHELETYIRRISASFGPLTDAQWHHLTIHSGRLLGNGKYAFCYDPKISVSFKEHILMGDIDLWQYWDMLKTPTLVIRGTESDVLLAETAIEMQQRGPQATVVELSGIGHAPILLDQQQITIVKNFLTDS